MSVVECMEKYEQVFGESITIPFELPQDKTLEDFVGVVQECIEKKERYDPKKYGFVSEDSMIV